MNAARLAALSHAQLVELAVVACQSSSECKNKADALLAQVAPLPAWCVDILMSTDLLPRLFSSIGLSEHAAACVCSTWSHAYRRQLRRRRYVDPRIARELVQLGTGAGRYGDPNARDPVTPQQLCMLPGGVLALSWGAYLQPDKVRLVAARDDSDLLALEGLRSRGIEQHFGVTWLGGLVRVRVGSGFGGGVGVWVGVGARAGARVRVRVRVGVSRLVTGLGLGLVLGFVGEPSNPNPSPNTNQVV